SAWSVLGGHQRRAANVYSRAQLFAWRLVLLSRGLCLEVGSWLPAFAPFVPDHCGDSKTAKPRPWFCHLTKTDSALACALGEFACVYGRVHAQSARYQHPALQRASGAAALAAGPGAAHAQRTARIDAHSGAIGNRR